MPMEAHYELIQKFGAGPAEVVMTDRAPTSVGREEALEYFREARAQSWRNGIRSGSIQLVFRSDSGHAETIVEGDLSEPPAKKGAPK